LGINDFARFVFALGELFFRRTVAFAEVGRDDEGRLDFVSARSEFAFQETADGLEGAVQAEVLRDEQAVEGLGGHVAGGGEDLLFEPEGDRVLADHVAFELVDRLDLPTETAHVFPELGVAVGGGLVLFGPEPVFARVVAGVGLARRSSGSAGLAAVLPGSLILFGRA
jgi:hypothetical protein